MPEQLQETEPRWKRRFADNREARQWNLASLLLTLPLLLVGCYYYGAQVLRTAVIAALVAQVCEVVAGRLILRRRTGDDWNAIVTGVWIACMLPAQLAPSNTVALYAAAGAAFAVLVVKIPFGGTMHVPFTPAAAGFGFLAVCFPHKVFAYLPSALAPPAYSKSLAAMLQEGRSALENGNSVMLGRVVGPMGACTILALAAALLAMLIIKERRSAAMCSVGFLLSAAALAFLFPRVIGAAWQPQAPVLKSLAEAFPMMIGSGLRARWQSVGMELCAGSLLFAAVFLLPEPSIMPARWFTRLGWGAVAGALCMLLRHLGRFEEGVCFAILLADAFMPLLYRIQAEGHHQKEFREMNNA